MKAVYSKRSLCECDYPFLWEHVPIGKVFEVDMNTVCDATLLCGGCHKKIPVHVVQDDTGGWLPLEIFTIEANA